MNFCFLFGLWTAILVTVVSGDSIPLFEDQLLALNQVYQELGCSDPAYCPVVSSRQRCPDLPPSEYSLRLTCEKGKVVLIGIYGSMPQAFGGRLALALARLTSLKTLYIFGQGTRLSGTIPTQIGLLSQLNFLDFCCNDLVGTIPTELGSLSSLAYITLYGNRLSGTIPPAVANLPLLQSVRFQDNQLSGVAPRFPTVPTATCTLSVNEAHEKNCFSSCEVAACCAKPIGQCTPFTTPKPTPIPTPKPTPIPTPIPTPLPTPQATTNPMPTPMPTPQPIVVLPPSPTTARSTTSTTTTTTTKTTLITTTQKITSAASSSLSSASSTSIADAPTSSLTSSSLASDVTTVNTTVTANVPVVPPVIETPDNVRLIAGAVGGAVGLLLLLGGLALLVCIVQRRRSTLKDQRQSLENTPTHPGDEMHCFADRANYQSVPRSNSYSDLNITAPNQYSTIPDPKSLIGGRDVYQTGNVVL